MLAPLVEAESAPPEVARLGAGTAGWWAARVPGVMRRGNGLFMIGATMIESDATGPITFRSASELMSAAFALHPGFAEAAIVEMGSGLRPAWPDNVPRLTQVAGRWHLNGLYRHGFLTAPALAMQLADTLAQTPAEAALAH